MQHRVTRELFEYWRALRGTRPAPDRADIDPGAIRGCLAHTFLLSCDPDSGYPFRIAGTAICAMFGRELTGTGFDRLWHADDRDAVADLVAVLAGDTAGSVASVSGLSAAGDIAGLEIILLPLTGSGPGRVLGALSAVSGPYWLGTRPLATLRAGAWQRTGADTPARNLRRALLPIGHRTASRGRP